MQLIQNKNKKSLKDISINNRGLNNRVSQHTNNPLIKPQFGGWPVWVLQVF